MNNRKLQKKIRQAFTNATPDLAENIAVASLFTDKPEAEKELPPSNPIRTPIQFRATAALVASILVVAMLIGLIPMINPFVSPNGPGVPIEPTTPIDIPPLVYTDEEIEALKQAIFSAYDLPFSIADAVFNASYSSWNGRKYHSVSVTNLKIEDLETLYFFVDDETMTVHPYDPNKDLSSYVDYYIGKTEARDTIAHQIVLVDNKVCYALMYDEKSTGKFLLIDAASQSMVERRELCGSSKALNELAVAYNFIAISYWDYNWNFKLTDGAVCYEINFRHPAALYALADATTGEILQVIEHTTTDPTDGPPLKPTPEYAITEDNALNIALEHAGLTMHDLSDYLISGNFQLVFPYYEVVLYTGDYKYYYWIDASYGTVAQLERTYSGELTSDDINSSLTPNVAAVELAKDDPLIKYKDPAFKSVTATPPYYTVRMDAREYHCKVEVSVTCGIVTSLHMINENFFIVIDDGINFQLTPILPHREPMIDFTPEQVKIWLAEGMTYSEIKLLIGEQNSNVSPTPIDEPWYVWYFNEGIYKGMRLEIRFKYPGYDHIDDWYADMNVHTKPYPDYLDAFYYEDDGTYLNTWLHGMKAVAALIRNGDETIEVLFGEDWYFGQGTDEPDLDRPPKNPINQMDAYDIALQHAGITNEDVEHCDISLTSSSVHSHYLIVINTADNQYTYQISDKYGIIISAERHIREPQNFKHESVLSSNALSKKDALEIVKNDPMYQDSLEFVSVEGPYTMTDVFGNSYPTYEVHFKDDGYGDPKYSFVVCQSHKLVERVIMHTDETTFYDDEPVVPDGRLGSDRASSLAVDHLGVSVTDVYMLTCREVTDDPEMANHYDVTFYYENFKWHYKIGMYNPTILEIEQIPLDE